MLCPKCGGSFMQAVSEERACFNCGYSSTVVSADVLAEVEKNLNRKKLRGRPLQLPSLPKWMPTYILDETSDELETVSVP